MNYRSLLTLCVAIIFGVLAAGCSATVEQNAPTPSATADPNSSGIANPAAVFCIEQGYRQETRTDAQGNQYGVCIFPDGSECDEWAYYRGECKPAAVTPSGENKAVEAAKVVLAEQLGIDAGQITIFSLERITWPDSCLGIPARGEACSTVETPGFRVILTVGENHYTFHTDLTGENIRQETAGTHGGL